MLYSRLGNTGLIVSRLSLGTMTFTSGDSGAVAKTNAADAQAMVDRAIDAGINLFDTADVYAGGESETMLGQLLGSKRNDVVVATRAGWRSGTPLNRSGLSAAHLHWSIDQCLQRLDKATRPELPAWVTRVLDAPIASALAAAPTAKVEATV